MNPEMVGFDGEYEKEKIITATKWKPVGNQKTTKRKPSGNYFKRNVSKKSRQEWGERMNHLRHIV